MVLCIQAQSCRGHQSVFCVLLTLLFVPSTQTVPGPGNSVPSPTSLHWPLPQPGHCSAPHSLFLKAVQKITVFFLFYHLRKFTAGLIPLKWTSLCWFGNISAEPTPGSVLALSSSGRTPPCVLYAEPCTALPSLPLVPLWVPTWALCDSR